MPGWTFFGNIEPVRANLSFDIPDRLILISSFDLKMKISTHLSASHFICYCSDIEGDVDIFTLRNVVKDSINSIVDIVCYLNGVSLDVDILSARSDTGEWRIFGAEIPFLYERNRERGSSISGLALLSITQDGAATRMLADFREAMRVPVQTGFFCYRAIEAAMQTFRKSINQKNEFVWDEFRKNLNIDRDIIDHVKSFSDWARHGNSGSITDQERVTIFDYTDKIIERYIIFICQNRQPLDNTEFIVLSLPK